MEVTINLSRTEGHIAILEDERRILHALLEELRCWKQEAILQGADTWQIDAQIKEMNAVLASVNRRKAWLEETVSSLGKVYTNMDNDLQNAVQILSNL